MVDLLETFYDMSKTHMLIMISHISQSIESIGITFTHTFMFQVALTSISK